MQLEKRFDSKFGVAGWCILYFIAFAFLFVSAIFSTPLIRMLTYNCSYDLAKMIGSLFSLICALGFLTLFLLAFYKAFLFFINTLSLGGNKFSINIEENSFLIFVLSNILLSIVTIGIYAPWAYKAVTDKIIANTEYEGGGRFEFRSKAWDLFLFTIVCVGIALLIIAVLAGINVFLIKGLDSGNVSVSQVLMRGLGAILFAFFSFIVSWFVNLLLSVIIQVIMLKWFCNLSYTSETKNRVYVMEIDMKEAVLFMLGQTLLLTITIGFYAGVYLVKVYAYFSSHIVEKDGDKITGRLVFKKQEELGALYLFLQLFLTGITLGIYGPFALVACTKALINNIYLSTEEDGVERERTISDGEGSNAKENAENA